MDYIVTVPDLVVPRIIAALTPSSIADGVSPKGGPDVPAILKAHLQGIVISYEAGQAAQTKQASVAQEAW